ncbi:MAG: hypothetical protein LBK67_12015 [Coriobacteriales bacterium]|nr:hypothetical protein [Coriobacteriales bacterium]
MSERDNTPSKAGAFGSRIGGLLLLFVVGCIAYIVFFPVGMVAGIAMGLTPPPHLAVAVILVIMELVIIAIVIMILRRDRRFIYAYVAGLIVALVMCAVQGVLGIATLSITLASSAVCLIGAALILTYFLRSRRVKAYLKAKR